MADRANIGLIVLFRINSVQTTNYEVIIVLPSRWARLERALCIVKTFLKRRGVIMPVHSMQTQKQLASGVWLSEGRACCLVVRAVLAGIWYMPRCLKSWGALKYMDHSQCAQATQNVHFTGHCSELHCEEGDELTVLWHPGAVRAATSPSEGTVMCFYVEPAASSAAPPSGAMQA